MDEAGGLSNEHYCGCAWMGATAVRRLSVVEYLQYYGFYPCTITDSGEDEKSGPKVRPSRQPKLQEEDSVVPL